MRKRTATIIEPWRWAGEGLPQPVAEYRFHPLRKWRFDYAWQEKALAIELEGGAWIGGRHTRGAGYSGDMEKYNSAILLGWRVLRYQPGKVNFNEIREAFNK